MSLRARKHLAALIAAVLAFAVATISDAAGSTKLETYVAAVGVVIVFACFAMFWIEMAPDGAWRKPPEGGPRA